MILGIGTDIIEINRVNNVMQRSENFLKRNFSLDEIKYFEDRKFKIETIAGAFSAKEAVSKAIGTGFRGFSLIDIEIIRDELGKPNIRIGRKVEEVLKKFDIINYRFHISISHSKENAIAYVILEGDKNEAF